MHLCLVEDTNAGRFLPLTLLHPVYHLRCGVFTLGERIVRLLHPTRVSLHCRRYLVPLTAEQHPGSEVGSVSARRVLVVNGRCLMTPRLARTLRTLRAGTVLTAGEEFVAAMLEGSLLDAFRRALESDAIEAPVFTGATHTGIEAELLHRPWDLISRNDDLLEADAALVAAPQRGKTRAAVHRSAVLSGRRHIRLGAGSLIGPGAVLDATHGPVCIGPRATIHPLAVVQGPACIGEGAVVNPGARILGGTSIGPVCKVGGEVQHSILHSYANKQHDGFLGHSYLGPWVNLGAGTTTSNLKNTYGNIVVQAGEERIDTGMMFLGILAADHFRTGINVSLTTGTIAGVSCNILGPAIAPRFIPSFSWGPADRLTVFESARALEVAARAMRRRGIEVSAAYAGVFRHLFEGTAHERPAAR